MGNGCLEPFRLENQDDTGEEVQRIRTRFLKSLIRWIWKRNGAKKSNALGKTGLQFSPSLLFIPQREDKDPLLLCVQ